MDIIIKRKTIQRALILDAVKTLDNHPTADDVYDSVLVKCPSVSKGTVYRNLNSLVDDGEILRVAVANAPDRFDHTLGDHCHAICLSCGRVFDVPFFPPIDTDAIHASGFTIVGFDMLFRGYCSHCNPHQ